MRVNLNFKDFLERTGKTYRSIDSRAALVKVNDCWKIGLLVLRFSADNVKTVEMRHEELKQNWGKKTSTAHFEIALDAMDIAKFDSLREDLKIGGYRNSKLGLAAELGYSMDLLCLESEFPSYSGYFLEKESEWPCFCKSEGKHLEELYKSKEIEKELWDLGLVVGNRAEVYVLIQKILEVANYRQGIGFNLLVYAPLLAKIERHIRYDNSSCTIGIQFHEAFDSELRLSGNLENRQRNRQIKKTFGPLSPSSQGSKELSPYLRLWEQTIELKGLTSNDYLNIQLLHRIPENLVIDELQKAGSSLVKPINLVPATNPLVAALQRFVGEDLSSYLKLESKIDRPQDKFELKICKILGLCGFSVAKLGGTGFDVLKDKGEPKVERGKCNILAYLEKRNCLLVVECTKNLPEDRDIRGTQDACATLQEEVFQGTGLILQPILFVEMAVTTYDKNVGGVRIIDVKDVGDLTNCLSRGENLEQLFLKFFIASSPSVLEI